ncbi:glutathione S-transferase family protein [Psychrobacter sp.]|uniref:glutathione S-transferase family protein n=1 Tax=Psychrobacter sp. TaxID=56811 RepID=UPI0025D0007D|nr:glutathione S-transferase family protein [Psychrobacter sp.]
MGLLVEGKWQDQWYDTEATGGRFQRDLARFRSWVTVDGSAGPSGSDGFKAEPNRYHLYVSLACPWAHRTLIYRKLKGLEDLISVSVVHPLMHEHGWTFNEGEGVIPDPIFNADYMHQIYTKAKSDYTGRVTVPVLWDKKNNTIVSNESSEIIRMFNSAFDEVGANKEVNFLPDNLVSEIEELNEFIYPNINNGVYKSGFATTQEAYEEAVIDLFKALDTIEARLENNRYLTGDTITEADWRLFTTLVRFDPVYVGHFKCNIRRIYDYPNLWGYTRDLYQVPGVAETVNMDHIKTHYYGSHDTINPTLIVPVGPEIDFMSAHGRERLSA